VKRSEATILGYMEVLPKYFLRMMIAPKTPPVRKSVEGSGVAVTVSTPSVEPNNVLETLLIEKFPRFVAQTEGGLLQG
jgi:hypothetical protein